MARHQADREGSRPRGFDPAEYAERTKGYEIHTAVDPEDEGGFSWSECDTCGSRLGGNRTDCILTNPGRDAQGRAHESVSVRSCDDCLYYAAYGHLPGERQ